VLSCSCPQSPNQKAGGTAAGSDPQAPDGNAPYAAPTSESERGEGNAVNGSLGREATPKGHSPQPIASGEGQAQRESIHGAAGAVVGAPKGEVESVRPFEVSVPIV